MRACILVPELSRSGGIDVVQDHARRLASDHGVDVAVVPVADRGRLEEARAAEWDVALATWWTTIPHLRELRAARRGVLAQGFDPLHYRPLELADRLAASAALAAPYDVIGVSEWVCDMVRALRPSARCAVLAPGIDKTVFGGAPRRAGDGPLRVLVEGQPSVWFKGVDDALQATRAMTRRAHVTVVATDPAAAGELDADRVVGGLDAAGMAALYREVDVVVKLSRFEGLGLAPLEAFHAGVPCVVTPYGGHAAYLRHDENGLLAGFDDVPGTARALDRLDADRALLARLSEGALATAGHWPDRAASAALLHDRLGELTAGDHDPAMIEAALREAAPERGELLRLHGMIADRDAALEHERGRVAELDRSRIELSDQIERATARVGELAAEIEEATSSRAYRAAMALRSLLPGRR